MEDGLDISVSLHAIGTSRMVDGELSKDSEIPRKGMFTTMLCDFNNYIWWENDLWISKTFEDVDAFIRTFRPVYGFGHIEFNKWCYTYLDIGSPELRVWPYNLFNLDYYPPELLENIEGFVDDHPEQWTWRHITDEVIELRTIDRRTRENKVGEDVTRAVLGAEGQRLVPRIDHEFVAPEGGIRPIEGEFVDHAKAGTGPSLHAVIVCPRDALGDDRLFGLLESLARFPNTSVGKILEDRDRPFFDAVGQPIVVNGVEMGLDSNACEDSEHTLEVPEDLGYLIVWVEASTLLGVPGQQERLLEVLEIIFHEMVAVYGVTLLEEQLQVERMEWEEFSSVTGGVHMVSERIPKDLMDGLKGAAPDHGDFANGTWLRFSEDYYYGMPSEYHDTMHSLLSEMWKVFPTTSSLE
jgi:hypothetical protein